MSSEPQSFDRVLSSMCTEPYPAAKEAATRFLATNPGDPETFPTVAEREEQAIDLLGDIAGLAKPAGYITTGGTEANIQAMRIARERSDCSTPNIVVPESAHFSFRKAANVLGVDIRTVPTNAQYRADPEAITAAIDAQTAAVVAVAGSTEYGRVDPIPRIARIAADHDILCHVDAAWGGFVLPFTDHDWHFGDAPIDTLTIDPHKMGRAPIPAGGLLARSKELLDLLHVQTPYLESDSQATLSGTRSGGGVAGTLVALQDLWPTGYRTTAQRQQRLAEWLATEFDDRDIPVVTPELPLVAADIPTPQFTALRDRGWRISRTRAGETRIVCMPHVTRETLNSFLADLDQCRVESPIDQT